MDLSTISNKYSLSFGNKTDVGQVRQENEDYMACFQTKIGHIFIVCDGMGGHTSGEVASRLAVTKIREFIELNSESSRSTKQLLIESIDSANQAIIDKTIENPEYEGMGTTCVILVVKSGIVYYANVGDSRIYLTRNEKIYQLTKDQSFVQTLVDQGLISYEDSEFHPRKNELIQALGINEKVVPEVNEVALKIYKDDKLVLCSDGLSGMITDEVINEVANKYDPVHSSEMLVQKANENGGNDNITVQVISILEGDELPADQKDLPPAGALDKNVKVKKAVSPNDIPLNEDNEQYRINQNSKNKTRLILFLLLVFISIPLAYYLFVDNAKPDKNIINNNNDSSSTENASYNLTENDKVISEFLSSVYKGSKTEGVTIESFKNIKFDTIDYKGSKPNSKFKWDFTDFLNNIKKYNLVFKRLKSKNNFIITDGDKKESEYRINYTNESDIFRITEISFEGNVQEQKSVEVKNEVNRKKNSENTQTQNSINNPTNSEEEKQQNNEEEKQQNNEQEKEQKNTQVK